MNSFDWSKWGFWLGLFLFFLSLGMWIYQTFIFSPKPELNFEIISNEEILTLKQNLPEFQIFYNNTDLIRENKNVSILTFRIINRGNIGITPNLYDTNMPLGFIVRNGTLISEPKVIQSSDSLYFSVPILRFNKRDTVMLKSLIIDEDEFFDLKCLILNKTGLKPTIEPMGKLSGIKKINVVQFTDQEPKSTPSFWYQLAVITVAAILSGIISEVMIRFFRGFKERPH